MPRKKPREITNVLARLRRDYPVNENQLRQQKDIGTIQAVHKRALGKSLRNQGHDTRNLYLVHVRSPEAQASSIHGRSLELLPHGKGNKQRTFVYKGVGVARDTVKVETQKPMSADEWEKHHIKFYGAVKVKTNPKGIRKLAEEHAKWDAKRGNIITDPNVVSTFLYKRHDKTSERRYLGAAREATIANAIEMSNLLRNEMKKLMNDPFVQTNFPWLKRVVPNVMEPIALFDLQQVPIKIKNRENFLKDYARYLSPKEKKAVKTLKGARWFKFVNGLAATSLKGKMRHPAYFSYSVPLNIRLEGLPKFKHSYAWEKIFDYYGINLTPESIKTKKIYSRFSKKYHTLPEIKKSILYSFADRLSLALYTMDVKLGGSLSSHNMGVLSAHNITASATLLDMDTAGFHKTPNAANNAVISDFHGIESVVGLFAHKLGLSKKDAIEALYPTHLIWNEYKKRVGYKRVGKKRLGG